MRITTWLIRIASAAYLVALTTLLLASNPVAWLLGLIPDDSVPSRGTHFTAFLILAILVAASRLPWRATVQALALIVYALAIESMQGLVENRTVELLDYVENLLGLAAGLLLWRAFLRTTRDKGVGSLFS